MGEWPAAARAPGQPPTWPSPKVTLCPAPDRHPSVVQHVVPSLDPQGWGLRTDCDHQSHPAWPSEERAPGGQEVEGRGQVSPRWHARALMGCDGGAARQRARNSRNTLGSGQDLQGQADGSWPQTSCRPGVQTKGGSGQGGAKAPAGSSGLEVPLPSAWVTATKASPNTLHDVMEAPRMGQAPSPADPPEAPHQPTRSPTPGGAVGRI